MSPDTLEIMYDNMDVSTESVHSFNYIFAFLLKGKTKSGPGTNRHRKEVDQSRP